MSWQLSELHVANFYVALPHTIKSILGQYIGATVLKVVGIQDGPYTTTAMRQQIQNLDDIALLLQSTLYNDNTAFMCAIQTCNSNKHNIDKDNKLCTHNTIIDNGKKCLLYMTDHYEEFHMQYLPRPASDDIFFDREFDSSKFTRAWAAKSEYTFVLNIVLCIAVSKGNLAIINHVLPMLHPREIHYSYIFLFTWYNDNNAVKERLITGYNESLQYKKAKDEYGLTSEDIFMHITRHMIYSTPFIHIEAFVKRVIRGGSCAVVLEVFRAMVDMNDVDNTKCMLGEVVSRGFIESLIYCSDDTPTLYGSRYETPHSRAMLSMLCGLINTTHKSLNKLFYIVLDPIFKVDHKERMSIIDFILEHGTKDYNTLLSSAVGAGDIVLAEKALALGATNIKSCLPVAYGKDVDTVMWVSRQGVTDDKRKMDCLIKTILTGNIANIKYAMDRYNVSNIKSETLYKRVINRFIKHVKRILEHDHDDRYYPWIARKIKKLKISLQYLQSLIQ